jgi:hypothetical protein
VSNNKNPNEKQPGEREPGKFHFNPGNMSGKTSGTTKKEKSNPGGIRGRDEQQDKNKKSVDSDR